MFTRITFENFSGRGDSPLGPIAHWSIMRFLGAAILRLRAYPSRRAGLVDTTRPCAALNFAPACCLNSRRHRSGEIKNALRPSDWCTTLPRADRNVSLTCAWRTSGLEGRALEGRPAQRPVSFAGIVRTMILRSSQIDHRSKSCSRRAWTCQRPVMPGFIDSRRRCHRL
jgi:hypothetical protein